MICTTAKDRVRILAFWERHGLSAAQEAFGVSRRMLFLWQKRLRDGQGMPEALNPQSTKPHTLRRRVREWPPEILSELRRLHLTHWKTYPKCPRMNPHDERFTRTLQEEFVDYHAGLLLDVRQFNRRLVQHLLWHNTERPHHALGLKSPVQFLGENYPEQCKMWWHNTRA